ncbi:DUF7840 domain-containing protein [Moraxella oblonga]|uniref:DUF7840 domain-containing protein n=1 Tax=Moraxella oblonga TaxID=200413 RepID=UPI000B097BAF|nr:DUF4105 domain-containing protein [Moraxella oblonga]
MFKKTALCLMLALSLPTWADTTATPLPTASHATADTLADDIMWHRLLMFNGKKTTMNDPTFFVTKTGATDPKAELVANLDILLGNDDKKRQDFVCQFPARSHWLGDKLGLDLPKCPEVESWLADKNVKKMSLVHAEEHINRVGSSFAHTLIRLDTPESLQGDKSKAYSLNFASLEHPAKGENTLAHSVMGKSKAELTMENYQEKSDKYLVRDGRDLWEYAIDLNQDEIDQIMRHVWEVKNKTRYYSFLNNNCATEVLRFVDLVRADSQLWQTSGKITPPQEATQVMSKAGILTDKTFVPAQKTLAQFIINHPNQAVNLIQPSQNDPTQNGTKSHRVMVYGGHGDGDFGGVSVRGAYQDLLDRPKGKRDYLSVQIMGLDVRHDEHNDKTKLHEATLVDILALNPIGSSYAGKSWGFHAKAKQATDITGESHLVLSTGGEYGFAYSFGKTRPNTGEMPNTVCYLTGMVDVEVGKLQKGGRIGTGIHTGCVHHLSDKWRVQADAKLPYHHNGNQGYWQPTTHTAMQYDLSQNNAVRFGHAWQKNKNDTQNGWQVAYLHYF